MPFVRTLITFSLGIYAGIYTSQNYEVPKVESPKQLYGQMKAYINSKKNPDEK